MQSKRSLAGAWLKPTLLWLALLAAAALSAGLAWRWTERLGFERLDDSASRQLDLYASVLENELGKYDYLPRLLEIDSEIAALLRSPAEPLLRAAANRKLTRFSVMSGVPITFVLDAGGLVLASSDGYSAGSLVGRRLALGDYLAELAHPDTAGPFPSAAVPRGSDHCFAQPLLQDEKMLGVAVVCVSLEPLEATWTGLAFPAESEKPFVVDADGLVILSSVAPWKSRVLARDASSGALFRPDAAGLPGIAVERSLVHGAQLVRLDAPLGGPGRRGMLNQLPIPRYGWRLLIVSDGSEVWRGARNAAWAAGALAALSGVLLAYLLQRRRVAAQKLQARAQLQEAYAELERKVQERTAELLQAGKMALLGQLSTGISHELGQPLTALRALTGNAQQLLARSRLADVHSNLEAIAAAVERMGRITSQLKSFARKSSGATTDVLLGDAIAAARSLMQARLREERIEVGVSVPQGMTVLCDENRLEQVLVNLMANAADAMRESPGKTLLIQARQAEGRTVVTVSDSGPGLPEAVRRRLFEPFFTTKPDGEGLGLGLVISANIVQEFGGTLRAVDSVRGAAFAFDLATAHLAAPA